MKNSMLFFLLILALNLKAQDDHFNPYFMFAEGDDYYLLADQVNVREQPSLNAGLIRKLDIATKVTIESQTDSILSINGLRAPWYLVSYKENKEPKKAYIWGGFISLNTENPVNSEGITFLFGISKVEKDYSAGQIKIVLQARAARNNKQLEKIEFKSFGSETTARDLVVSGARGVKGIDNILKFGYSDNYCGGAFGDQIYFWDGKKFIAVKNLYNGVDAPCFSSQTFIYPEDEGGKEGLILLKSEEGCDEGEDVDIKKEITEFRWDKNKMRKIKTYKID